MALRFGRSAGAQMPTWPSLIAALIAVQAQGAMFDCERFFRSSEWTNSVHLKDRALTLEEALGIAAKLMAIERDDFSSAVTDRLKGTDVLERRPVFLARLFLPKRHVIYTRQVWPERRNDQLSMLFEAIRAAFSEGTADRFRWRQATPQERFRMILHFKANAVLVLFYQHRLYRSFNNAVDPAERLRLPSESGTFPAPRFFPLRVFSAGRENSLFDEVVLTRELETRLQDLVKGGACQLKDCLNDYTERVFLANLDSVYSAGEGIFPVRPATAATLIGTGAALTALLNWLLSPALEIPPGPFMEPPEVKQGPRPASVDRAIEELDEQAKQRPLSEEERIILDELRSQKNE